MPMSASNWLIRIARIYLMIAFPIVLILLAARLVMTPLFLQLEYNRVDFPPDPYGFTQADRLNYAPYALDYLLNGAGVEYLGNLQFPGGGALYDASELRHMRDVKALTQIAFGAAIVAGIAALAIGATLCRKHRDDLRRALMCGALFTLAIVAAIIVVAVTSWDTFFVTFHQLFFEGGTWYFPTSDTLIRLFPEQFWFDAAVAIGAITVTVSLVTFVAAWRVKRA